MIPQRVVEWARAAQTDDRGALGVAVAGWRRGLDDALPRVEEALRHAGIAHHALDLHAYRLDIDLATRVAQVAPDPATVVSLVGLREWFGPGEEAARRFGEALAAALPTLLESRRRLVLWPTPHVWDVVRRTQPLLAEQWTSLGRLAPPDPEGLIARFFEQWMPVLTPMRHRGHPERARRRLERFARQMDTFHPKVLTSEQLAWGVVIPWLRTLLDAGTYGKVVEEFRRWAPALEPVAAAYGLAMLCAAAAEGLLGRTGSTRTTLDEARVRLNAAGHVKGESLAVSMIGHLEARLGQLDAAEQHLAMGTQLAELAEAKRLVAWNCIVLAVLTLLRGREEESHPYLEYAWALSESEGDVPGVAAVLWADALRLWWTGQDAEAETQTRRVERILAITRDGPARAASALALSVTLEALDRIPDARHALDRARRDCADIHYTDADAALQTARETLTKR